MHENALSDASILEIVWSQYALRVFHVVWHPPAETSAMSCLSGFRYLPNPSSVVGKDAFESAGNKNIETEVDMPSSSDIYCYVPDMKPCVSSSTWSTCLHEYRHRKGLVTVIEETAPTGTILTGNKQGALSST
jgi:hypothetical protein